VAITGTAQGATPFLGTISATIGGANLGSVTATVAPQAGSHTRPFAATFVANWLARTGKLSNGQVTVPVYFLYAAQANTVALMFRFMDGSSVTTSAVITTPAYRDPCGRLSNPTMQQNRTATADIGFDYFVLKNFCSVDTPAIIDTDAAPRWVSTANVATQSSAFFRNGFYASNGGSGINRIELDGTVTPLADFSALGVTFTGHHNIDPGRDGLIVDVNTSTQTESVDIEFDARTGAIRNRWDLADIIGAAMRAGGDDPSGFVFPAGTDWFHNNATTYNKVDNTLIVSSRENFVIAVDYDAPADGSVRKIHWILGDPTKHWAQYASLRKYALTLPNGASPPIGQHAVSIDHLGNLLLFNDGYGSAVQQPPGMTRPYSISQSFRIDPIARTATEVFNFTLSSKYSYICGSIYEGYPGHYLIDYADEQAGNTELIGLGAGKRQVFDIDYPTSNYCAAGWNASPIKGHTLLFQ